MKAPMKAMMLDNLKESPDQVVSWFGRASRFVADVRSELGRVTWPTRAEVVATTVVFAGYLLLRHALGISSPGIGGHGSGFGDRFYSPEELAQRFGAHPLGFMIYNVAGGLASLLFAEPRQGVYALLAAWREGELHPVVLINVISSSATTGAR